MAAAATAAAAAAPPSSSSSSSSSAAATAGPTTPPSFPLLSILAACAAALAHKQLSSIPEYAHMGILALVGAVGVGAWSTLAFLFYGERDGTEGHVCWCHGSIHPSHHGLLADQLTPTPNTETGGYALLRTILYATCESDPLAETGKLMRKFGVQEAKQGIKVDRSVRVGFGVGLV